MPTVPRLRGSPNDGIDDALQLRPNLLLPRKVACHWREAGLPAGLRAGGLFLAGAGLAGLESLTKRMEAAAARVNLKAVA